MAKVIKNGNDDRVIVPATKYRFKKEFEDAIIILPGKSKPVTKDTLTDHDAERIMRRLPQFAHNLELIQAEAIAEDVPVGEQTEPVSSEPTPEVEKFDVPPTTKAKPKEGKSVGGKK